LLYSALIKGGVVGGKGMGSPGSHVGASGDHQGVTARVHAAGKALEGMPEAASLRDQELGESTFGRQLKSEDVLFCEIPTPKRFEHIIDLFD